MNELNEPETGTSSPPANMANSAGSNFQEGNDGFTDGSGAAINFSFLPSITDVTLDQALTKLKEIDTENSLLKEYLAENNRQMKRQFETLVVYKEKDKEKFDKAKALVTSLREEIKDFQMKQMSQEEKEKEHLNKVMTLEQEVAHLNRQKVKSDQQTYSILKQAEKEGVGLEDMESFANVTETVFVMSEDKEREMEELQATVSSKEDMISSLRSELLTVKNQRDQYKDSNAILLKDMEGVQKQKKILEEERQQLFEKNSVLNKELDKQMQSAIATTKKEIESTQNASPRVRGKLRTDDSFSSFDDAENLEEIFDRELALQHHQEENERLKADLESVKTELKLLNEEYDELKSQYELAQVKIEVLEKQKIKLSEEFEENLTGITQQKQENMSEQAKVSEDQSVLRSQVVSLLNEVDELNKRLSAATLALQQKERRIMDLSGVNAEWKEKYEDHWHQSSTVIQALQSQMGQQESDKQQQMQEHNTTKRQYQELQENFNKLVSDYREMHDMFEEERLNKQQRGASMEMIEEMNKLAAQVIAAEEAINYRDLQLEDHKKKGAENDEQKRLLEIQLDTYQSDFLTEREARTEIAQEKNKLNEELKQTQDKLRTVTDQLNQRQMEEMQRRVQPQRYASIAEGQRLDYQSPPPPQRASSQHENYPPGLTGFHRPLNNYAVPNNNQNPGIRAPPQPSYSQTVPSYSQAVPSYSQAVPTYSQAVPSYSPAVPSYSQAVPSYNTAAMHHQANAEQLNPENADEFPSLTAFEQFICPSCGMILPDYDSYQLHVPDCVDQQEDIHN